MLIGKDNMYLMTESNKVSGYDGLTISSNPFAEINPIVVVVVGIIAFIVAIVLLAAIVERKKAPRNKFLRWLREYLNFRSILISGIIKFVYLFLAVFLTIMSVVIMCMGKDETVLPMIGIGFALMIFGNVGLRILMEMTMAVIVIWENTSDIRSVMVRNEEIPEEKKPKEPKELKEEKVEAELLAEKVVTEKPVIEEETVEQRKVQVQSPAGQRPSVEQRPPVEQ